MGNVWAALVSWLMVKKENGVWVLRHEDLDTQRSRREYAVLIEDDLNWLGLQWDEGGLEGRGPYGPYLQSQRDDIYLRELEKLRQSGLLYGCRCRRANLLASSAPHSSDGRPIYAGTCRPARMPQLPPSALPAGKAIRVAVDDRGIEFQDMLRGKQRYVLSRDCGDFIVRRADGAFAYQLAVVADDAAMHITQVVRGCDLLPSAAQQIYLYTLLGCPIPRFGHIPLLCNADGIRLSKRDRSMAMDELRRRFTAPQIIGYLAWLSGLIPTRESLTPQQLLENIKDFGALTKVNDCLTVSQ